MSLMGQPFALQSMSDLARPAPHKQPTTSPINRFRPCAGAGRRRPEARQPALDSLLLSRRQGFGKMGSKTGRG